MTGCYKVVMFCKKRKKKLEFLKNKLDSICKERLKTELFFVKFRSSYN